MAYTCFLGASEFRSIAHSNEANFYCFYSFKWEKEHTYPQRRQQRRNERRRVIRSGDVNIIFNTLLSTYKASKSKTYITKGIRTSLSPKRPPYVHISQRHLASFA